jgi:hypothetical protein
MHFSTSYLKPVCFSSVCVCVCVCVFQVSKFNKILKLYVVV